jgi:uncharacterized protein YcbX
MTIGRVTGLYRYPVKSMMGEALEQVSLGERGIPGDRAWAVRDEERGGIRGGKRFPELMQARARYLEPPPAEGSTSAEVELPDGRRFAIDAAEAPGAISELVGGPVSVWPLLPAENLEHYRRGEPITGDMEEELRRIFGRTADEPLPDLSVFPELLMTYESPPGTYFDAFPLLIMTRNGLEHLQEASADHQFDVRRFRPNILLDIDGEESFPENAWAGRSLRIGEVTLQMEIVCPRCSMTTRSFDDLPSDPGIMRSLVKNAEGNLGMYASVPEAGSISVGDTVELLD